MLKSPSDTVIEIQKRRDPRKRWMIRVTTSDGEDMFLRRGHKPGAGPIVQFRTKQDAEINMDLLQIGLDENCRVSVVIYDATEE